MKTPLGTIKFECESGRTMTITASAEGEKITLSDAHELLPGENIVTVPMTPILSLYMEFSDYIRTKGGN